MTTSPAGKGAERGLPPPRPHGYWTPIERWSRAEIEALQLRKLRSLVGLALKRSPFWKRKLGASGVSLDTLQTLADVRRLPFLTKEEMMAEQLAHPPYGEGFTCSPELGVAYHQTSGTTGRAPFRVFETRRDWDWGADAWARGLYAFGLRQTDVVYFPFGYGPFIGFWGAHYAVQKIGAQTIPGGAQSSENRLRQIVESGATAIVATPSYALRLAAVAEELGLDLARETRVELILQAGEPGASIPSTRAMIEEKWGAYSGDFAGMTETGGISAFGCAARSGGIHIAEDHFLEEVVDPDSGEPVPEGGQGERITTSFGALSFPVIRYRTHDLVRRVAAKDCPCGRSFDLYWGGFLGRTDDMRLVRGTNVHPSAIEGIVRQYSEVREFRILLHRSELQDQITVELEPLPQVEPERCKRLVERVADELAYAHEGLRFGCTLVAPGSLPTFELKARRLVDAR